ncbi:MAG: RimK family alpha-L-glutamate ligase [Actinomycetales bacterium]
MTAPDERAAEVALVNCADERYQEPEVHVAADALRAAGVSTDVVSWDEDRDWGAYGLVVVRTPWDYFDRVNDFLDWAARVERESVLVNPADVLRWNSHKGYLAEFTAKSVPTVPTRLVPGPSTDVADQIREVPWEEIVVKPAIDGGARHAWRGLRDDPSLSRVAERLTDHGDVVVQPFVPAIVDGERSLVFLGGRFSHAVRKVPKAGDYRSQRHLGGREVDHEPDSAELQVALAAMAAAPGRLTYARVDLVDWEGAPVLIELEVIEPDLFLRDVPARVDRFVEVVRDELATARTAVL